jgi:hypothetical protein
VCDSDAPNQIVTLKRCVFDVEREGQALGSFSVTFEIGECEWQPDRQMEVDAAICAPIARRHCDQYDCTGDKCGPEIIIHDCMHVDFTRPTGLGAAIFIQNKVTSFWMLRCQFYRCNAKEKGAASASAGSHAQSSS